MSAHADRSLHLGGIVPHAVFHFLGSIQGQRLQRYGLLIEVAELRIELRKKSFGNFAGNKKNELAVLVIFFIEVDYVLAGEAVEIFKARVAAVGMILAVEVGIDETARNEVRFLQVYVEALLHVLLVDRE